MNEIKKKDRLWHADDNSYGQLIRNIGSLLETGKKQAVSAVNQAMVRTYWEIGKHIVEYEQAGNEKAEYGSETLKRLSRDLTERYGNGFGMSNINKMRKFYSLYPILQTVSAKLSWSHYVELRRQMKSMLFQRLVLSKEKTEVIRLSTEGQVVEKAEDILKDPYVFEFVGLPELPVYKEGDLENALVDNLSQFLLELGKGFTYVGRQRKINIGGRIYKVDLVFYHRILKCFVLIDLKRGEVQHEDIGQMNLYLNYFREELNTEGDTEPIGIVLGAYEDKLMVKYATQNISNQLFVSRYQLYLPNKEQLEQEVRRFLREE